MLLSVIAGANRPNSFGFWIVDDDSHNQLFCRYSGGVKLLACRNAAGLTAAKLAAKHGHVACVQLFNTLKKLRDDAAAGDGRPSDRETPAPSAAPVTSAAGDASGDVGGCGGTAKGPKSAVVDDGPDEQAPAVFAPAVDILVEEVESALSARRDMSVMPVAASATSVAATTSGVMGTGSGVTGSRVMSRPTSPIPGTVKTTSRVAKPPKRRSKSALPAARHGNYTIVS